MLTGRPAPDFRMTTTADLDTLEEVATLAGYRGRWVLLFFYPADFTFVCPTEVLALNRAKPEFDALGCDLLGISTDTVHAHVAWMEFHIGRLDFPLASDRTQQVSRAYGVLGDDGCSARATYLVDPEGVVRYEIVHDEPVGRSVDEILRVLRALRSPGRTSAKYTAPDDVDRAAAVLSPA